VPYILSQSNALVYEADLFKNNVSKSDPLVKDKIKFLLFPEMVVVTKLSEQGQFLKRTFELSEADLNIYLNEDDDSPAIIYTNVIFYMATTIERDMLLYHFNKLLALVQMKTF